MNKFVALFLASVLLFFTSCHKNNDSTPKQGYAPVTIASTYPTGEALTINNTYNDKNQLTRIMLHSGNDVFYADYTFDNAGLVTTAKLSIKDNPLTTTYQFTYANNELVKATETTSTYTTEWNVTHNTSLGSYNLSSPTTPEVYTLLFDADGNYTQKLINGVTYFNLQYGAGKGVYSDFPMQIGHYIPMEAFMLFDYFGSSKEVTDAYITGQHFSFAAIRNDKGYITRSTIQEPGSTGEIKCDITYELRNIK